MRTAVLREIRCIHGLSVLAVAALLAGACAEREDRRHAASTDVRSVHASAARTEVYWDGACKVEREWQPNGDYRDQRQCEDTAQSGNTADEGGPSVQRGVIVQPPPVPAK